MKRFWMVQRVLNMQGSPARFKHDTLDSATKEAERLCRETKESFVVLEAIKVVEVAATPVIWSDVKDVDATESVSKPSEPEDADVPF